MQIEDIEVHTGSPDFKYKPVRQLEAKVEAVSNFAPAPTETQAAAKLRSMAAKVGANAIINVEYRAGVSMTSWRSLKATGLAVVRESDEITCSECAETIKRAAKVCRFCGSPVAAASGSVPFEVAPADAPIAALPEEPMRETNNPVLPYVLATIAVVVMFVILLVAQS